MIASTPRLWRRPGRAQESIQAESDVICAGVDRKALPQKPSTQFCDDSENFLRRGERRRIRRVLREIRPRNVTDVASTFGDVKPTGRSVRSADERAVDAGWRSVASSWGKVCRRHISKLDRQSARMKRAVWSPCHIALCCAHASKTVSFEPPRNAAALTLVFRRLETGRGKASGCPA